MKVLIFILTVYLALVFVGPCIAYGEENNTSSVIVFGPGSKSADQLTSGGAKSGAGAAQLNQAEEDSMVKVTGPALNASFMVTYALSGSKFADVQVSEQVSLPSDGIITLVDLGMSKAFIIVRVDGEGRETLFLNVSPEHAIGQKLPKGIYKVYPQDPDGVFAREKITVIVYVGLAGNSVVDPRKAGKLLNKEQEQ